jgi:hypothetical protein
VFAYALLVAVVATGVCVVFAFPHGAPSCDEALVLAPIPTSWPSMVALDGMGGFRLVEGNPTGGPIEFVVEDGVCPGEGAPVYSRALANLAPSADDLRIRYMRDWDIFVLTSTGEASPTLERILNPPERVAVGDAPERPLLAFRPEPRLAFVVPPELTMELAGLSLAAVAAIVWGIARARRRLRLAGALLDPEQFVDATCKDDGTLWIGERAVVVHGERPPSRRLGRVVVRVAQESGGDYRTPPTAQVADVFQGDRRQAADRQLHGASLILSAFTAVTVSIAVVAGILSVDTWVAQEAAQRAAFSHRTALRRARIETLNRCGILRPCDEVVPRAP